MSAHDPTGGPAREGQGGPTRDALVRAIARLLAERQAERERAERFRRIKS
ncbi:MAG: hypothetical protein Q8P41_09945 [Pseudomonadota bacterium]|nr:hypothetical protein [Pseudomonadota bacterium]